MLLRTSLKPRGENNVLMSQRNELQAFSSNFFMPLFELRTCITFKLVHQVLCAPLDTTCLMYQTELNGGTKHIDYIIVEKI